MNNITIVTEITKLTDEWYRLIGSDECEDRDFHWYIETKWSYGQPPKYSVQHFGYIVVDIVEECDSYDEALLKLKEILIEKIEEEKNNVYRIEYKGEKHRIEWNGDRWI